MVATGMTYREDERLQAKVTEQGDDRVEPPARPSGAKRTLMEGLMEKDTGVSLLVTS
jgi:hypothetical protein